MTKQNSSEDVKTLFRRFGGDANSYHEIVSEESAEKSRMRWPVLRDIQPNVAFTAPSVDDARNHHKRVLASDIEQPAAPGRQLQSEETRPASTAVKTSPLRASAAKPAAAPTQEIENKPSLFAKKGAPVKTETAKSSLNSVFDRIAKKTTAPVEKKPLFRKNNS
jgi:hypothetical protein